MKIDFDKRPDLTANVENIRWERIHLYLTVSLTENDIPLSEDVIRTLDFYAADRALGMAGVYFDIVRCEHGSAELYVNITNNGTGLCIPAGTFALYVCNGNKIIAECETAKELTPRMDDLSRGFLYGSLKKSYNINFYVEDDSEELPFRMTIVNLSETNLLFPYNGNFFVKIGRVVRDFFFSTRANFRRLYKVLYTLQKPFRKKRVLFLTEQSTALGSNLTSIMERMKERGLDKDFTIATWERKVSAETNKLRWLSFVATVAKSETIFIDDHVPAFDWMKLKDTTLIQTWHAGAGFKSSGYSRWGHMGCPAPQSCHRQYTYGLCGSKKIAHFFSEVWGINTERVLNTGMPRMDEYQDDAYREETKKRLYEAFPMCKGKKVILFAPTYRGKSNKDAHYPYELIDWKKLHEICGDTYIVLFKMHPWVIEDIQIPEEYRDKMLDVKTYPNINDLFYFTDLLITDYSSNIYEYSLMRRPMLFFAFDEIQYSFSRGFHRPYRESAPGKVCTTFDELIKAISDEDFEFEKVEDYVKMQFDHFDSNACDRVIDWILLGKMPKDISDAIKEREARAEKMRAAVFPIAVDL